MEEPAKDQDAGAEGPCGSWTFLSGLKGQISQEQSEEPAESSPEEREKVEVRLPGITMATRRNSRRFLVDVLLPLRRFWRW